MTTLHRPLLDEQRLQIHGSRILVISDEPADVDAISDLLLTAEFSCVIETVGHRDPVAVLQTLRPDLVLLNQVASGSENLALLRRTRAAVVGEAFLPLLVIGEDTPGWRAKALAMGADDVVLKPLVAEELLARVHNLLVARWLHCQQRELSRQVLEIVPQRSTLLGESFLEAVVNSLDEAVLACDQDGQLRFANHAAVRLGLGPLVPGQRAALAPGRLRSPEGRELTLDEDPLRRAWAGHEVVDQELTIGTSRRGTRVLLANARPLPAAPDRQGAVVALHDITDRRRVTEELRRGLLEDELTGLPNAVLFLDLAKRAIAKTARDHQPLSLIVISLDEVDEVSDHDALGGPLPLHPVLAALAERLPRLLRPGDVAARYGDGFALLCGAPVFESSARRIADRLRAGLSRPLEVSRRRVTPRLSLGVATSYDASLSAQGLIQLAIASARRAHTTTGGGAAASGTEGSSTGW
jgi:diguanylate cyclase (GGDEF)-like protein